METMGTLVGNPAEEPRKSPTRRSSQASPSDPSVAEVSERSESGTERANGKRLAVEKPATVLTTGVAGSAGEETFVFPKVTGLATRDTLAGGTS